MRRAFQVATLILALAFIVGAQPVEPRLAAEAARLDSYATTPDGRLIVAALMADRLNVHRNHLILLRKQTGQAYSTLFVGELRARSKTGDAILTAIRELNNQIDRELKSLSRSPAEGGSPPLRAIGFLSTTVDRNSAATFYTATPEVGVEGSRGSVVVGLPLYFNDLTSRKVSGVGDIYTQGQLLARARGFDFSPTLTVGFPTGESGRGLGAGKLTVDGTVTVARTFESRLRPFVRAGLANYVFNNVAYQRPYISTGGAAHFSGGLTIGLGRRTSLGIGGFAVAPFGDQQITSREVMQGASSASASVTPSAMGHNSGAMPGVGHMPGGSSGVLQPGLPPFMQVSHATVQASDLQDRGVNTWTSIAIHPALSIQIGVARSFDFDLTTVRVGLGFNFGRLLFPRIRQ
ncbi:MAG: hypothetical protein HY820_16105 [Acidobacteria bacterium]|nr:hypothetical protein [Acidobacteriota bacterium]